MKRSSPPRRRKALARGAPPQRSGPIRKTKRSASEWRRIYGSKARVAFVASLPCACGCRRGPCENAHTLTGGVGRKGHYLTIIPLFPECHRTQHAGGWEAIGMTRAAAQLHSQYVEFRWQSYHERGDDE